MGFANLGVLACVPCTASVMRTTSVRKGRARVDLIMTRIVMDEGMCNGKEPASPGPPLYSSTGSTIVNSFVTPSQAFSCAVGYFRCRRSAATWSRRLACLFQRLER